MNKNMKWYKGNVEPSFSFFHLREVGPLIIPLVYILECMKYVSVVGNGATELNFHSFSLMQLLY